MLSHIVKHLDLMPREAVLDEIKRAILATPPSDLPRRLHAVLDHYTELKRHEGVAFKNAVCNFVLWLGRMDGRASTPPPVEPTFKDPLMLIKFLPHKWFAIKIAQQDRTLKVTAYAISNAQSTLGVVNDKDSTHALLRQAQLKKLEIEVLIPHEGAYWRLVWVAESGTASIYNSTVGGYVVKPLKELLK